ncbi:hypothetical protein CCM_02800 [Cordyceps militaris CM01]|uniref:Uncharacterized protein n=1 Tax=Cordyceps militaris (strain CM01) TaxID=983644 RepID=G3JBV6_CORMM|nr:uncharacterized protein CCM_02800 [Cordyceps militaris CM01]EGX94529.1 hypothetical protein CCM_02800 [Cordyceps militaris CM01]
MIGYEKKSMRRSLRKIHPGPTSAFRPEARDRQDFKLEREGFGGLAQITSGGTDMYRLAALSDILRTAGTVKHGSPSIALVHAGATNPGRVAAGGTRPISRSGDWHPGLAYTANESNSVTRAPEKFARAQYWAIVMAREDRRLGRLAGHGPWCGNPVISEHIQLFGGWGAATSGFCKNSVNRRGGDPMGQDQASAVYYWWRGSRATRTCRALMPNTTAGGGEASTSSMQTWCGAVRRGAAYTHLVIFLARLNMHWAFCSNGPLMPAAMAHQHEQKTTKENGERLQQMSQSLARHQPASVGGLFPHANSAGIGRPFCRNSEPGLPHIKTAT